MTAVRQESLSSVRLVLMYASSPLNALSHVGACISEFLDCTDLWTLEKAADRGLLKLMDRFAEREWSDVGADFRLARCKHSANRAASRGMLEVLQWWIDSYLTYDGDLQDLYKDAIYYGHLNVVQWLYDTRNLVLDAATVTSVRYGRHPEVIYWLRDQGCRSRLEIQVDWAVSAGDLAFLERVHQDSDAYELKRVEYGFEAAANSGDLKVLKWLCGNFPADCAVWLRGIRSGFNDFAVTRWLLETYPVGIDLCHPGGDLMKSHNSKIMKWAMEEFLWKSDADRTEYVGRMMLNAAERGDICFLDSLWRYRDPAIDSHVMERAAGSGQLQTIQWIHKHSNMELPSEAIHMAIENGHLGVVKWLHTNGVQVDSFEAMDLAASNNHLNVVQWLHEHLAAGCTTNAMDDAAAKGHLAMVQWLHEHRAEGCTTIAMDYAAANGHLKVVEYLDSSRCEGCTSKAMDRASANGHVHVVKWLHDHRSEGCASSALKLAVLNGSLDVVKYLLVHCELEMDFTQFISRSDNGLFAVKECLMMHKAANIPRQN